MNERHDHEVAHGQFLAADPLKHWGHASWAGRYRIDRRVKLFVEHAEIRPGAEVLELGFGTGEFTRRLALTGAHITGIDISPDLKRIAANQLKDVGNVSLVLGDAETLAPFMDGCFDAIVGNSVLHHLDVRKTLSNVFRVLKPGGHIVFSEPNMLNPQIALQKNIPWLKKALGDSPDETAFFEWQMRQLLKRAGFTDIHVVPFDFLHPALPDSFAKQFVHVANVLEYVPLVRRIAGSLLILASRP